MSGGLAGGHACSRRCGRRRSSASASTTRITPREQSARRCRPSRCCSSSRRSAVIGPGEPIRRPPGVGRVDHEAELGVVIGRRAHRVLGGQRLGSTSSASSASTTSRRAICRRKRRSTRAARGSTRSRRSGRASPPGSDREPRAVEGWVNGQRRQSSSTQHLIFPIEHLVEFITFVMTLEPGDIISTGTPEGDRPAGRGRFGHGSRSKASASSRTRLQDEIEGLP